MGHPIENQLVLHSDYVLKQTVSLSELRIRVYFIS